MPVIEEVCTITAKGQTTVPKPVRQALGVGYGDRIGFRVEGGIVSVHAVADPAEDPARVPFLTLLERDIAAQPAALAPLTAKLVERMAAATEASCLIQTGRLRARSRYRLSMLESHGWRLFGHPLLFDQIERLAAAAERARRSDPEGWHGNTNVNPKSKKHALKDPPSRSGRRGARQRGELRFSFWLCSG